MTSGASPSLHVLHEDADCLAVVKPAGQFTQGTWAPPGELTLEQAVRVHLDPERPESAYVGIVHRLDRPTSGVLIWAKTPKAARRLSAQFERRRVEKEYWALVERTGAAQGESPGREGVPLSVDPVWTDWLTRTARTGSAEVVGPETPGARSAVTRVAVQPSPGLIAGLAWLRLRPETGRTHQLRAQAGARGLPILGDHDYGAKTPFGPHAIALHARELRLRHPTLQTPMTLIAPLPLSWTAFGIDDTAGPVEMGITRG